MSNEIKNPEWWLNTARQGAKDLNQAINDLGKNLESWQDASEKAKKEAIIEYRERVKKKLQEISNGEYGTWIFVQAFFNVLDKETPP